MLNIEICNKCFNTGVIKTYDIKKNRFIISENLSIMSNNFPVEIKYFCNCSFGQQEEYLYNLGVKC